MFRYWNHYQELPRSPADLEQLGFSQPEIMMLLKLREDYQTTGSDRVEVIRHWMFLKYLVIQGKMEL